MNLPSILLWLFIATVFADGANLDDLFANDYVLHDDQDVLACATSPDAMAPPVTDHAGSVPNQTSKHQPAKGAPASPVRVVIDQDSPSLAPDAPAQDVLAPIARPQEHLSLLTHPRSQGELHLRFCTLLI